MDCCFVNMPYSAVVRPSLAFGLLQARLEASGMSAVTINANLLFCERIGLRVYEFGQVRDFLFGDWTFSHLAFPDYQADSEILLERVFTDENLRELGLKRENLPELLMRWRRAADDFIEDLAGEVINRDPLMVGCSTTFTAYVSSLALLYRIRQKAPHIVTIMGGAYCQAEMGLAAHENFPWVDFVVSGEADDLIVDLVRGIREEGRSLGVDRLAEGVFGPVHRRLNYAGMRENPPRAMAQTLKGLPAPRYDDYFETLRSLPSLSEVVVPALPVEGSRGCWWVRKKQCLFCSFNGRSRQFRTRPDAEVLKEMEALSKRYGVTRIGFSDNIINPRWFKTVFAELAHGKSSYVLSSETTPRVTRRQLQLMAEAGVRVLQPGIENLDQEALALLNKGSEVWHNIRLLKWCLYYGIYLSWSILDVPGAPKEWYTRTARLMPSLHHLQPPMHLNRVFYCRFNSYHSEPDRFGLDLTPLREYYAIYPLAQDRLKDLVWYFEDKRGREAPASAEDCTKRNALIEAIVAWKSLFLRDDRPVLETHDTGTELFVRDTRPAFVSDSYSLVGDERAVYVACEEGIRIDGLYRRLSKKSVPQSKTERIVGTLLERGLLADLDGRLLALGLPRPLSDLKAVFPFLCGGIDRPLHAALCLTGRSRDNNLLP